MFTIDLPPPPPCGHAHCTDPALVHWQRRLTQDEIDHALVLEQQRRDDAPVPWPDDIPLPDGSEYTCLVHACGQHAIHMDAAARIHQAQCAGPDSTTLPHCGCDTEEQPPAPTPPQATLPDHWTSQ